MKIETKGAFVLSTAENRVGDFSRPSPPDSVVADFVNRPEIATKIYPHWAFFNRAVFHWQQDKSTYFLERAVHRDYLKKNLPDRCVIVVTKQDENGNLMRLRDLDLPIGEVFNWEDPRVHVKSHGNGTQVTLGLTAVKLERGGYYGAYPSLVNLGIVDGQLEVRSQQVFSERGKNVVPIDDSRFIYRRESATHVLDLVRPILPSSALTAFGGSLIVEKHIDFSQFSDVFWIRKKIGAVARPIDFGDLRILPVHGVRNGSGEEERGVDDVYAVGIAIIDKNWQVVALDPEPLFEREHFLSNLPISGELNNKKRVVYCCDFIEKADEIIFLVNVSDSMTVFRSISRKSLEARALRVLDSQNLIPQTAGTLR